MRYRSAVGEGVCVCVCVCVCVLGGMGCGGLEGTGRGNPDYRRDVGGHDESKMSPFPLLPPVSSCRLILHGLLLRYIVVSVLNRPQAHVTHARTLLNELLQQATHIEVQ